MSKDKNKDEHKYLCYCIPAGLLVGTVAAVLTPLSIGIGAGMGMLLGIVIGTTIDYEAKNKK